MKNLCSGGFHFLLILDLWGISFHAVIVFDLGKNLLFKSVLGHCVREMIGSLFVTFFCNARWWSVLIQQLKVKTFQKGIFFFKSHFSQKWTQNWQWLCTPGLMLWTILSSFLGEVTLWKISCEIFWPLYPWGFDHVLSRN